MTFGLSILASVAALVLAAALHWALWRLGRRFPVILARRVARRRPLSTGEIITWQRNADLLLLPIKLAIWAAALYFVSERFSALAALRSRCAAVLQASFTRPLFAIGTQQFSALDFLLLPVALAGLWLAVSLVTWLFRSALLGSTRVEPSVKESLSNLLRYSLLLVGALVVLQLWGLDASTLAIAGSALGVGLGFGLRNIANNFISGVLIGLERPIKVGDYVEVGKFAGTVERVGARSTEIRTQDRVTILVPNSMFLETEVINWSHGDPTSRLRIQVGVAYGTPIAAMRAALLEVGQRHPEVLDDPAPEVQLAGFGESALLFELLVWTDDPREQSRIRSDLHLGVEAALRRAGIEIPYPHRVLQMASVQEFARGPAEAAAFDFSRRIWTEEDLAALAERMRGEGEGSGVAIEDRRYLLNLYPRCFVGREAVAWLRKQEGLGRREAIHVGRLMVEQGHFHHVLDEHPFDDGPFFYRFYADEQ